MNVTCETKKKEKFHINRESKPTMGDDRKRSTKDLHEKFKPVKVEDEADAD